MMGDPLLRDRLTKGSEAVVREHATSRIMAKWNEVVGVG
jgi:hypothetical protein